MSRTLITLNSLDPEITGNWENTYTKVKASSANWDLSYTTVQANSATWGSGGAGGSDVSSLSANWQNTYNTVTNLSSGWNYQGTDIKALSSNWQDTYTTVQANSATWSNGDDELVSTKVRASSANWDNAYNTVNSLSSTWGGGGSGVANTQTITNANTFAVGDPIYYNGSDWVDSDASAIATADVVGLVESATGSEFTIVYSGAMTWTSHGFTLGATIYLAAGGGLTTTEPTTDGHVSKPVAVAIDANTLVVVTFRGVELGSGGGGGGSSELVPLGTVSVTSAADIKLDNIFNNTLYDHYIFSVKILPATDNVILVCKLRNSTPSTVVTVRGVGGAYVRTDSLASGTATRSAGLIESVSNVAGRDLTMTGKLIMGNGNLHQIAIDAHLNTTGTGGAYFLQYAGDFNDATPRQGILFDFSSGNVASGTLSVWGVKKQ
jgi:hypothetical protein